MKKLLSLTLAVIMLLSVMPFSYSASAKLSADSQECVYAYVRLVSYGKNFYGNRSTFDLEEIINEAIDEVETRCAGLEFSYEWLNNSKNSETINEATKIFKSASEEIEMLIETDDITVVIDTYEYFKYFQTIEIIYSKEEIDGISKAAENEKYVEMLEEAVFFYNEAEEILHNIGGTQEEFDDTWKKACPIYDMIYNCLEEKHNPGEFVSNNDATYEADGTKTAECEFCGATVTVVDEGSKLVKEEEKLSFIDKLIAFIRSIFEKIFSIFG